MVVGNNLKLNMACAQKIFLYKQVLITKGALCLSLGYRQFFTTYSAHGPALASDACAMAAGVGPIAGGVPPDRSDRRVHAGIGGIRAPGR